MSVGILVYTRASPWRSLRFHDPEAGGGIGEGRAGGHGVATRPPPRRSISGAIGGPQHEPWRTCTRRTSPSCLRSGVRRPPRCRQGRRIGLRGSRRSRSLPCRSWCTGRPPLAPADRPRVRRVDAWIHNRRTCPSRTSSPSEDVEPPAIALPSRPVMPNLLSRRSVRAGSDRARGRARPARRRWSRRSAFDRTRTRAGGRPLARRPRRAVPGRSGVGIRAIPPVARG